MCKYPRFDDLGAGSVRNQTFSSCDICAIISYHCFALSERFVVNLKLRVWNGQTGPTTFCQNSCIWVETNNFCQQQFFFVVVSLYCLPGDQQAALPLRSNFTFFWATFVIRPACWFIHVSWHSNYLCHIWRTNTWLSCEICRPLKNKFLGCNCFNSWLITNLSRPSHCMD